MSTQTTDSDSPSAAGFQLGYLHKQADLSGEMTIEDFEKSDIAKSQEEELINSLRRPGIPYNGAYTGVLDPATLAPTTAPYSPMLTLGGGNPFADDPSADDDADPLSNLTPLTLAPKLEEVDQAADGRLQLAKYRPVKTEAPAARDNREAIKKILTSLAPGAAIGGTAGVGLSLAGDARKGGGVNLGKAVGMGVGGATLGALIQGLAQRNKMKAMMA